jgi:putative membrane protein
MITANSVNVFRLIRPHWHVALAVLAVLAAVEFLNDYVQLDRPAFSLAAVGLLVTSLSIFLVFRVNEGYARWWEARTLWGQLVNASRSFTRQVTTLVIADANDKATPADVVELRRELVYRQIAFANALRLSLRQQDRWDELEPFLQQQDLAGMAQAVNKPAYLLQHQGEQLAEARAHGLLSEMGQNQLDRTMHELHSIQGSCERIKNAPFPENVAYVTRAIAWIMAIIIAIAILEPDNRFDPVDMIVVPILMFSFVLIERLGAELKNPFENAPNDTPMTALCRSIERDLRQALGEQKLPPRIDPEKGILM